MEREYWQFGYGVSYGSTPRAVSSWRDGEAYWYYNDRRDCCNFREGAEGYYFELCVTINCYGDEEGELPEAFINNAQCVDTCFKSSCPDSIYEFSQDPSLCPKLVGAFLL